MQAVTHIALEEVSWHVSNVLTDMLAWCIHTEGKESLQKGGTCSCSCCTVRGIVLSNI